MIGDWETFQGTVADLKCLLEQAARRIEELSWRCVRLSAERDEAREAARLVYHTFDGDHNEAARRWPWIEQEEGIGGAT